MSLTLSEKTKEWPCSAGGRLLKLVLCVQNFFDGFFFLFFAIKNKRALPRWWWCRASCPRMSADILGTNCEQCVSMVQCCFTSTETRKLIRTESPGRLPRLSHSSWTQSSTLLWSVYLNKVRSNKNVDQKAKTKVSLTTDVENAPVLTNCYYCIKKRKKKNWLEELVRGGEKGWRFDM